MGQLNAGKLRGPELLADTDSKSSSWVSLAQEKILLFFLGMVDCHLPRFAILDVKI